MEKLTLVIALAAIASAVGTIYYAIISHKDYRARQQVFIGVPTIGAEFHQRTDGTEYMRFLIFFRSFGANLPVTNVVAAYQPYLDGVAQPVTRIPDQPTLVMPGGLFHNMDGNVPPPAYRRISVGEQVLEVSVTITYNDFYNKPCRYYTKTRYDHVSRNFMKLEETLK
jgi:hypothetical protein